MPATTRRGRLLQRLVGQEPGRDRSLERVWGPSRKNSEKCYVVGGGSRLGTNESREASKMARSSGRAGWKPKRGRTRLEQRKPGRKTRFARAARRSLLVGKDKPAAGQPWSESGVAKPEVGSCVVRLGRGTQADERSLARDTLTSRRATSHVSASGLNRSRVSCSRSDPKTDRAHQSLEMLSAQRTAVKLRPHQETRR